MEGTEGRLASLAYEVARADDIAALRAIVTGGLRTVIAADLASYTEVSPSAGTALALVDSPTVDVVLGAARLAELADQHPLIVRSAPRSEAISDHLTRRAFHALELYQDVYRDLGAEDQLAVTVHRDADLVVGLALNRSRRGFSARDRRTLDALGTVVRSALATVQARARGRELLAGLQEGVVGASVGVIALSDDGRVAFVSTRAREWLRRYFPDHRGATLPAGLAAWPLQGAAPEPTTAVHRCAEATLTVVALPARSGEPRLLELREHLHSAHVLTARERGILARIALGESNAAAARALGISPRTVENHLRAIYRKLGVNSRTAAVARSAGARPGG